MRFRVHGLTPQLMDVLPSPMDLASSRWNGFAPGRDYRNGTDGRFRRNHQIPHGIPFAPWIEIIDG